MAALKTENEKIEYYIYLIVIKLAVLIGLKSVKVIYNIHAAHKRSLKKKYQAKDIEAPKPQQRGT